MIEESRCITRQEQLQYLSLNYVIIYALSVRPQVMKTICVKRSVYHGPVTSLCYIDKTTLCVGQGHRLRIYDTVDTASTTLRKECFLGDNLRIHGIIRESTTDVGSQTIIVHCGKVIFLFHHDDLVSKSSSTIQPFLTQQLPDWVLDVALFHENDQKYIAFAYAHNYVDIYKCTRKNLTFDRTIRPVQQCILYCARFIHASQNATSLVLVAGTVMNEVWMWDVFGDLSNVDILRGHEGVVFGIAFNHDKHVMATVSDDRTVRLWDLNSKENIHTFWGHEARIWDILFYQDYLVSASEDSTLKIWKWHGDSKTISGVCLSTLKGHRGKNVWCIAASSEGKIIASGGEDSGVILWSIEDCLSQGTVNVAMVDSLSFIKRFEQGMIIRDFQSMSDTSMVASTTDGRLLSCDWEMENIGFLYTDSRFAGHNIVKVSPCNSFVIMGNSSGLLVIASLTGEFEPFTFQAQDEKIFSLEVWETSKVYKYLVATRTPSNRVCLHAFYIGLLGNCLTALGEISHPAGSYPYSLFYEKNSEIMLVGGKKGSIAAYDIREARAGLKLDPIGCLRRVHKQEAVTCMVMKSISERSFEFISSGKDSSYVTLKLSETDEGWEMFKIDQVYLNRGWIEDIRFIDGHLYVLGFDHKYVYLLDETSQQLIMSHDCGGAHRKWSLWNGEESQLHRFNFLYQRNYEIHLCRPPNKEKPWRHLQESSLPGKEIRSSLFLQNDVIATGAENGQLTISGLFGKETRICCRLKHDSVVKCLAGLKLSSGEFLLAAGGAREELLVWKIIINEDTDIQTTLLASGKITSPDLLVRVMDVNLVSLGDVPYLTSVYSDSTIRRWEIVGNKLKLICTNQTQGQKCILSIRAFTYMGKVMYVTGSTDGDVVIWETEEISGMIYVKSHLSSWHQSGVNCIDIKVIDEEWLWITTGGDDNALNIGRIRLDNLELDLHKVDKFAHASAIQGVAFKDEFVLSISWDQRLIVRKFIDLEFISSHFVNVADPSTMSIHDNIICIAGIGLEMFTLLQHEDESNN